MSAEENLNPQQFYHGSPHVFQPGDLVDPSHEISPDHDDGKFAYLSPSRERAAGYGRVHTVEPTGLVERVPYGLSDEYQSSKPLRVTGQLPEAWWTDGKP